MRLPVFSPSAVQKLDSTGGPLAESRSRVLWLKPECSPCYQRECPLGHFRCMREISVESVLAEMARL